MIKNDTIRHWYVLYTMPRQEFKIKNILSKQGVEVFLPVYKSIRQWSDRKKCIEVPLFSSYLFIRAYHDERFQALSVPGAVTFISTQGKPDIIHPKDIDLIQQLVHNNPELKSGSFTKGEQVKITDGPFKGTRGYLEEIRGRHRVSILVESLAKVVTIDISPDYIELAETSPRISK